VPLKPRKARVLSPEQKFARRSSACRRRFTSSEEIIYSPLNPVHVRTIQIVVTAVLLWASACFVGYDSRWGEAKRAQSRVASEIEPTGIVGTGGEGEAPDAGGRSLLVRMHPSGGYLAQTVDARKRVADLLDDSNVVLRTTLGITLELDRIAPWSGDEDQRLGPALQALQIEDEGRDVDVVVGMIGALPRQTDSLHELGMATVLGKHIVVRAASRLGEHDAVDKAFYELNDDERSRILRQRERHRALAVFLHEIGHILGALHETDPRSLMHPSYNTKMNGFASGAIGLMRASLANRGDRVAIARAQLDLLRGPSSGDWVAEERNAQIARLQSMLPSTVEAGASASSGEVHGRLAELRGGDDDRFSRASAAFRGGAIGPAYETAKPLFAAYPNVLAVQDLRCQLATVRWLDREALSAECAPFVRLFGGDAGLGASR
jgi:Matrixin